VAAAIPRDLRIDERGLGYLRRASGQFEPYGHTIPATNALHEPIAQAGADTTGPTTSSRDPAARATIGASHVFKATVKDPSGVRSVAFKVGLKGSAHQSYKASNAGSGVYAATVSGLTNGTWTWRVVSTDNGGNTTTSSTTTFFVKTSSGGGGTVPSAEYHGGGAIQNAAGRLYFEMPDFPDRTNWTGYWCSGTVVKDGTSGRSIVQTAAHCVYDDENKAFARNVLFIPNQAGTTGDNTDLNCSNDPLGCWTPAFGVVDRNWAIRVFPDNVAWDYAYYVVRDAGSHTGSGGNANVVLDDAVSPITISFAVPAFEVANSSVDHTTALGYPGAQDPNFMYCAQDMTQYDQADWWLGKCELTGGSSGGPWMQPFSGGTGSLVSVNSWGFLLQPGMAGPKLSGNSASCIFNSAKSRDVMTTTGGEEGLSISSCP
jgi:hypothetical protein